MLSWYLFNAITIIISLGRNDVSILGNYWLIDWNKHRKLYACAEQHISNTTNIVNLETNNLSINGERVSGCKKLNSEINYIEVNYM